MRGSLYFCCPPALSGISIESTTRLGVEKKPSTIVLFSPAVPSPPCRWSLFYRNYGRYLDGVQGGESRKEGEGATGGCRCTLRCAVSITHPSTVSTSPNRRFCRRTNHFSCSNLFQPPFQPLPPPNLSPTPRFPVAASVSRIRVYAPVTGKFSFVSLTNVSSTCPFCASALPFLVQPFY